MYERPYPTRDGLAIPTNEVELPVTKLNQNFWSNFNNHHREWPRKAFGANVIYQTLRDLESMQELLPKDIHNKGKHNLHSIFDAPKMPTPKQALERIEQAYDFGESLRVWDSDMGEYVAQPITHEKLEEIKRWYNKNAGATCIALSSNHPLCINHEASELDKEDPE